MKLLENGFRAFPEIINCIKNARSSIHINMFIWRNDNIGNRLIHELLSAADRGVQISLSKDHYAAVLESAEESRKSFFHRKLSPVQRVEAGYLQWIYDRNRRAEPKEIACDEGMLLKAFLSHANVHYEEADKYDHSKFWIFDKRILILGGMNVEDKENGQDYAGREYRDLMAKISEPEIVSAFIKTRENPQQYPSPWFNMNLKKPDRGKEYFGMRQRYLELIRSSEKYLDIIMAYFSSLPDFADAICDAANRGVKVRILIPGKANFMDDMNKRTVKKLQQRTDGKISVYVSPCMVHTKLLITEKEISFGSCNITKKAFCQLDELNLFIEKTGKETDKAFVKETEDAVSRTFAESSPAEAEVLRYNVITAALETAIM